MLDVQQDLRETSIFGVCVHERERERGGSRASSPMLAPHILAHTALWIRGREGYSMILDLVMRWVLLELKVRLN